MKRTMKKWLTMMLAGVLCLGLVQTTAWAETDSATEEDADACEHEYGDPVFVWSEDYASCVAEFTCVKCGYVELVDCTVSSKTTATCTESGETTYTATAKLDGVSYSSDPVTVDSPALGHNPQWNAMDVPNSTGTESGLIACYICTRCRTRFADEEATIELSNSEYQIPSVGSAAVDSDKTVLEDTIKTARAMNSTDNPEANWRTMSAAIASAEYVLNCDAATQSLVDGVLKVLRVAMGITEDSEPEPDPTPDPNPDPDPDPDPEPGPGPEEIYDGVVKGPDGIWGYYDDGELRTDYTGVAPVKNDNGWWYINKGLVDFNANTVAKNDNGWWYVTNGKVNFDYTGLANYKNDNGWWYITNGAVDFKHNGVDKNKNGWFYVTDGKVNFDYTGLANYKNASGWWYISKGAVNFNANTVAKNSNGWFLVENGKVNFNYTGVANYKNANGWWYVKDGKVDFSYNGKGTNKNGTWNVVNGRVRF